MPGPSLRGCSLGEYPRQHYPPQSQVPCGPAVPAPARIPGSLPFAFPPAHAPRPGVRRFPPAHGSAPLHRRPPRRPRPPRIAPHPRPPASCFVPHHHASGLPEESRRNAPGIALRERLTCRPHRRLARPPPGATGSSVVLVIPGASAFVPHLCSLVIPAGTLDPAPCGGKEHLSVLR